MRLVILALSVLTQFPITANGETLGGVWHVTKTDCGGKTSDFLSISESVNGGPVTDVYHLDSIEFTNRHVTFVVGGHRLEASTSLRMRGDRGTLKIRLLGEDRDASWKIDDNGLAFSILGVEEQPVVITGTRQPPVGTGRTKR
jgi:hypothetical protein